MNRRYRISTFILLLLVLSFIPANAEVHVQCPGDTNEDAQWTGTEVKPANTVCIHIAAGDGFILMADGKVQYTFGFLDVTGVLPSQVMDTGMLAANFAAPTIKMKEGDKVYLTLTNVGMAMRPDLFDPHSLHFHGFVNAAPVFDGEPMASLAINMGSSITYYYEPLDPGTYMYHCHVEASEHMQMGMLGSLYVTPGQDRRAPGAIPGHLNDGDVDEPPYGDWPGPGDVDWNSNGVFDEGTSHGKYAYNDGDGSTRYDVDYPLQIEGFDPIFHDLHLGVQPLPFANMKDTYPMLNGRGYPDTVRPDCPTPNFTSNPDCMTPPAENGGKYSQRLSSKITAKSGQKILLRISSLATIDFYTLSVLGIPMKVVGRDAKILRDTTGTKNLYYTTSSVTLGGGESVDVILDTSLVSPGTYFLYTTNLNNLSNNNEDYGGLMTEIVIE